MFSPDKSPFAYREKLKFTAVVARELWIRASFAKNEIEFD